MGTRHSVRRRAQGGEEVGNGKRVTAVLRANMHTSLTR